jgi:hypothetical protein
MIEFEVTDEWYQSAKEKADELGHLNHSIRKGAGNLVGFIGEHIAQHVLGGEFANTYEYDLVLENGLTIDVKTKMTSVTPLPHYMCTIADYYLQDCDYYAFVRVHKNLTKGWFLGFKKHDELISQGIRVRKGDVCKENGFVAKLDVYDMPISDLDTNYEKLINQSRTS